MFDNSQTHLDGPCLFSVFSLGYICDVHTWHRPVTVSSWEWGTKHAPNNHVCLSQLVDCILLELKKKKNITFLDAATAVSIRTVVRHERNNPMTLTCLNIHTHPHTHTHIIKSLLHTTALMEFSSNMFSLCLSQLFIFFTDFPPAVCILIWFHALLWQDMTSPCKQCDVEWIKKVGDEQ